MGHHHSSLMLSQSRPSTSTCVEIFHQGKLQIPCMFFCYLAYTRKVVDMVGTQYSQELGHDLLNGCGRWQIVKEFQRDTKYEIARAYVVVNEEYKTVIVAFRGTQAAFKEKRKSTINDWMFGCFDARLTPWQKLHLIHNTGSVHNGFLRHYQCIGKEIIDHVKYLLGQDYFVIFTGHSQGGALASFAALQTAEELSRFKDQIFLITFGCPNIGNKTFLHYYEKHISPTHIIHYISYIPARVPVLDAVTLVPPSIICNKPTGKKLYIRAEDFGSDVLQRNQKTKSNTNDDSNIPFALRIHFQEVYMYGVISPERVSEAPIKTAQVLQMDQANKQQFVNDLRNTYKSIFNNVVQEHPDAESYMKSSTMY